MSVPVSRILFFGSDHSAEFAVRRYSNRLGFAKSAGKWMEAPKGASIHNECACKPDSVHRF